MASAVGTTQIGGDNVSFSPSTLGYDLRDFSRGSYRKYSIAQALVPPNSVSHAVNWNFDTIIGSAVVRPGTTLLGAQVASGKSPLGLFEFTTGGSAIQDLLAVFTGASTASIYYFDTAWHTSGITNLSNTLKCRFAQLGNQAFIANGAVMKSSVDGNSWGTTNCITTDSVLPSLLFRTKARLLASGDLTSGAGHSRSRVYFSSIVDPSTSPGTITWDTNATVGNWIDVNPDDGSDITGFGETSGLVLVFKDKAMYRLDAINNTVDLNNVYPFGAVSQESIVGCQGYVYFFTGQDIQRTNGGFPEQISRLGVQDFVDGISQSNWSSVSCGTDGQNVFFSIGAVTVPATGDDATTYSNVVLKFSVRDENWSVHAYGTQFKRYCQFTNSTSGRKMIGADTSGNVQTIDLGTTDNSVAINYDLRTQELDFGTRSHVKHISSMNAYMQYGLDSSLQVKQDDGNFALVGNRDNNLNDRINTFKDIALQGNYFTFRVIGSSSGKAPVFEGLQFETVTDHGVGKDYAIA